MQTCGRRLPGRRGRHAFRLSSRNKQRLERAAISGKKDLVNQVEAVLDEAEARAARRSTLD